MIESTPKGNIFTCSLIALIFLAFAGCSDQGANNAGFKLPPLPVEVADVKTQNMFDKFEAVGTIEAIENVTIVSEIDALVKSIPYEEGGFIASGSLIAQLDDVQLIAEVNRTEAIYEQSKSAYNRIKSIVEQKAGTPQDLDDALANLKVAESNMSLAKARLSKTKIVAPFSGMIGARKVSVGSFVRVGQEIAQLANLNEIRVTFSAPEKFLSELKRNSEVTVSSSVFPGYEIRGRIISIEPILNSETRNVNVVARVQNPGQKFRPGMSADVSVVLNQKTQAVTIPTEAVFANGNQSFVFIVNNDSSVSAAPIVLGLQTPQVVEVTNGLLSGMMVVRAGHQKLFDGAKVLPIRSENIKKEK